MGINISEVFKATGLFCKIILIVFMYKTKSPQLTYNFSSLSND